MAFQKGHKKVGGRTRNTPNKQTAAIKDMVIAALSNAGGIGYLERQAKENPTAFLTLVGKVIPLQVAGDQDNPVKVVTKIMLVGGDGV